MGHKQHRVGRLHPSFLRRVSVPCEGNRKGRKAYCGLVRMWSSPCRRDGEVEKIPSLMGKSDASERNESWLSNCREQLISYDERDKYTITGYVHYCSGTTAKPWQKVKDM